MPTLAKLSFRPAGGRRFAKKDGGTFTGASNQPPPVLNVVKKASGFYAVQNGAGSPLDAAPANSTACSGWRTPLDWEKLEPTQGTYNFSLITGMFTKIAAAGDDFRGETKKLAIQLSAGTTRPHWLVDQKKSATVTYTASASIDSGVNLAEDLTTVEPDVTVGSGTLFQAGLMIRIDTEDMMITARSGADLTVTRGYNGTTAATHTNGADVYFRGGTLQDTGNSFTGIVVGSQNTAQKLQISDRTSAIAIQAVSGNTLMVGGTWTANGGTPAANTGYTISDRRSNLNVFCITYQKSTTGGVPVLYVIAAPWDLTMMDYYCTYMAQVAQTYDADDRLRYVCIGGPNGYFAEVYLTPGIKSLASSNRLAADDYSQEKIIVAWKQSIDQAVASWRKTAWLIWYTDNPVNPGATGEFLSSPTRDNTVFRGIHPYALSVGSPNYIGATNNGVWDYPRMGPSVFKAAKRNGQTFTATATTFADSGQDWATNEWRDARVVTGGSTSELITSNNATTLTFSGGWATGGTPANNLDYQITGFNDFGGPYQQSEAELYQELRAGSGSCQPLFQIGGARSNGRNWAYPPYEEPGAAPNRGTIGGNDEWGNPDAGLSTSINGNNVTIRGVTRTKIGPERLALIIEHALTAGARAMETYDGQYSTGGGADSLENVLQFYKALVAQN